MTYCRKIKMVQDKVTKNVFVKKAYLSQGKPASPHKKFKSRRFNGYCYVTDILKLLEDADSEILSTW